MRIMFFCTAILFFSTSFAQPKSEGLHDSLNGKLKSMNAYFFNIKRDSKGQWEMSPDYFTHHQEFLYNENNVLIFRNFYETKKKISESRDMIAFNKPDPAVRKDTSYLTTDSSREMLVTHYRDNKITQYYRHITPLKNDKISFWQVMNAEGKLTLFDKIVITADGKEISRWQLFADSPINLDKDPNFLEKYNKHGHLILTLYTMNDGTKKSSGRKYEYDDHFNATLIQFSEWNPDTNKYDPVRETRMEYKYKK